MKVEKIFVAWEGWKMVYYICSKDVSAHHTFGYALFSNEDYNGGKYMKAFGLKNVKAFIETPEIELAPITVFVGRNSCGKSSFMRFPAVISQTVKDTAFPLCLHSEQSKIVDFGSFKDVLNKQSSEDSFSCKFAFEYNKLNVPKPRLHEIFREYYEEDYELYDDEVLIPHPEEESLEAEDYFDNKESDVFADSYEDEEIYYWEPDESCDNARPIDVHVIITYAKEETTKNIIIKSYKVTYDDGIPFLELSIDSKTKKYMLTVSKTICGDHFESVDYKALVLPGNRSIVPSLDLIDITAALLKNYLNLDDDQYKKALRRMMRGKRLHFSDPLADALELFRKLEFDKKELKKRYNAFRYAILINEAIELTLYNEAENTFYIGPFRSNPERIYRRNEITTNNVGSNGEQAVKMLINYTNSDNLIMKEVSAWFEKAFNYELCVETLGTQEEKGNGDEYYQIVLRDLKTNIRSNIMDVGYGISQVLPIVTQIAHAIIRRNNECDNQEMNQIEETYIIEQPELHLHPKAQAELPSLFVQAVNMQLRNVKRKILIETHSEHLIRGLQLLIADKNSGNHIDASKVKIYYVHSEEEEEGKEGSWIEEMKLDSSGQFIRKWPNGFFDKSFELMKKLVKAVAENRKVDEHHD